jgi:hypothetical protein
MRLIEDLVARDDGSMTFGPAADGGATLHVEIPA